MGIFGWLKVLKRTNDDDLKAICGTDTALYLIFLRFAAIFFCAVTVISLLIIIPIYLSGVPLAADAPTGFIHQIGLSRITILNITAENSKPAAVFALMYILTTSIALIMLFFYWRKSMEWRY